MAKKPVTNKKAAGPLRKPAKKKAAKIPHVMTPSREESLKKAWEALPGNQFWNGRSRHGVLPILPEGPEGAQKLLECATDYFDHVESNPLMEAKLVSYEGISTLEEVPKMRPFTIAGLCAFLRIGKATWYTWKARQDLIDVVEWIDVTIREQKFNGAAAGMLNAMIISRDLGLADKSEVSGPGGGPIANVTTEMTPQEAAELYARTREAE